MARAVVFGECMVELSLTGADSARVGYAGDTFNTAVYLRRLGRPAAYATALGRGDRFSLGVLGLMRTEGIDTDLVTEVEGRLPGLYAIERDAAGERSFFYWRGEAPIRDYARLADLGRLRSAFLAADLIYLSGISLAVVGEDGRRVLTQMISEAAAAGVAVAFDPNHRPRLWRSREAARAAMEAIVPACRFLSFGDEEVESLFGRPGEALAVEWARSGLEVVRRDAGRSAHVHRGDRVDSIAPMPAPKVVDTTGAGDAFNAAYLASRMGGEEPAHAVRAAQALAARVVAWPGAILPRDQTAS